MDYIPRGAMALHMTMRNPAPIVGVTSMIVSARIVQGAMAPDLSRLNYKRKAGPPSLRIAHPVRAPVWIVGSNLMTRKKAQPTKRKRGRPKGSKTTTPRKPSRSQELMKLFNCSSSSLSRFRKREGYPGDDAKDEDLKKWYQANKSNVGRPPAPKTPDDEKAIDSMHQLRAQKLQAETEKIEIATGKHLEKVMDEYRTTLLKRVNAGLDIIFREIRRLDLDPSQLKKIQEAAKDAAERIRRDED